MVGNQAVRIAQHLPFAAAKARAVAIEYGTAFLHDAEGGVYVAHTGDGFEVTTATLVPPPWMDRITKLINTHG